MISKYIRFNNYIEVFFITHRNLWNKPTWITYNCNYLLGKNKGKITSHSYNVETCELLTYLLERRTLLKFPKGSELIMDNNYISKFVEIEHCSYYE